MDTAAAQAPAAPPSGDPALAAAIKAEGELRFDTAVSRLYELLIERPGSSDAPGARLRLARLLALTGNLPAAVAECQLVRDQLPADDPRRERALELSTILLRRIRAASGHTAGLFDTVEALASRGLPALDEPRTIAFESESRFVLLDQGAGRVFRIAPDGAAQLSAPSDPSALTILPDHVVVVAGKTGFVTVQPTRAFALTGTWGGKSARSIKKVRSMAPLSTGDLILIDRDYDGILKCVMSTGACAPWGPAGKYRLVRIDRSDWVYLVDDRGETLRIVDSNQRLLGAFGPLVGTAKLEKIEDLAVDDAFGIYLLDTDLKRVTILHMRSSGDGKVTVVNAPGVLLPQEGDRVIKSPTTIAVSPGGWLAVTGRSSPRVMRLR